MDIGKLQSSFVKWRLGRENILLIMGNVSWLTADQVLRLSISLVVSVWIARYLGPSNFGQLSFALAFVALFASVANCGIDGVVVREVVNDHSAAKELLGSAFVLKLLGGVITFLVATSIVYYFHAIDTELVVLVAIIAAANIFRAFDVVDLWFQALVRSKYPVLAKGGAFLIISIIKVVLILMSASVIAFGIAVLAEVLLAGVALYFVYVWSGKQVSSWQVKLKRLKFLLKAGAPLVLSGTFVLMNMQIDMVMLGELLDKEQVGIYSAATRMSQVWYFLPVIVGVSIMKNLVQTKNRSLEEYRWKLQKVYDVLSFLGLMLAIVFTFLSGIIIELVFGEAYRDSAPILSLQIWSVLFVFHVSIRSRAWIVEGKEWHVGLFALCTAIVNIGLNFFLIPLYGGIGAAVASIISWLVGVVFFPLLLKQTAYASFMFWRSLIFFSFWKRVPHVE